MLKTKYGFKHDDKCLAHELKGSETVEYVLCHHFLNWHLTH